MSQVPLRVLTSATEVPPTTVIVPNGDQPMRVSSSLFEGDVLVRLKGFPDDKGEYFARDERKGKSWSIEVRGRFLDNVDAEDLVFGNIFQKPIRDSLPWGTSVALKFIHYIDPAMTSDVYADKPWALSPLLATTPYLSLRPHSASSPLPDWSPSDSHDPLKEDSRSGLIANLKRRDGNSRAIAELESIKEEDWDAGKRKTWIQVKENRQKVVLEKEDLVTIDFAQGMLDFNDLSVSIPAVGFHVDLLKYWDGQPVTFICRNRAGDKTYFAVAFEIADPNVKPAVGEGVRKEGDEGPPSKPETGKSPDEGDDNDVEISDEVD